MTFTCAARHGELLCPSTEKGDRIYLGFLELCVTHQDAFEASLETRQLLNEVTSARIGRGPLAGLAEAFRSAGESRANTPPVPARVDRRAEATVYFIRCTTFVKIGYSLAPLKRLRQLQASDGTLAPEGLPVHSASIIATMDGGHAQEQKLHRRFAHLRHTGEWFNESPELTNYIESLVAS